jgi:twitching motility protein PilU
MNEVLTRLLNDMAERRASDLLLSVGAPAQLKVDGVLHHAGSVPLTQEEVAALAAATMTPAQQQEFAQALEMNLAIDVPGVGRFRINVYRQRGHDAMVVRYLTSRIPTIEQLNLPSTLRGLAELPRGLILVVGAAGAGKSTTVASMIEHLNQHRALHILTVEDPIEYVHEHRRSVVDQREVGIDTRSFADALRNALREAPDVLVIGEIRDRETMQSAIAYAETGHLCLATLHANNSNQALDRIVNFFPGAARSQVLADMALNLRAVISQRLLRGVDGLRVPAVEVLLTSAFVAALIQKGEIAALKEAMKQNLDAGMMIFDESLYRLYESGRISYAEAMNHSDSRTDLSLRIRLQCPRGDIVDDLESARLEGSGPDQRFEAPARPPPPPEKSGPIWGNAAGDGAPRATAGSGDEAAGRTKHN